MNCIQPPAGFRLQASRRMCPFLVPALALLLPDARVGAAEWIDLLAPGDLSHWESPAGDWQVVADAAPSAQDPQHLVATPGQGALFNGDEGRTTDLLTRQSFGDVELHIEFLVADQSNSGVYLMGRYELQVLDSFGVTAIGYPGNQCGGIYPRWLDGRNIGGQAPRSNVSKPAGDWQSFDIAFRAPRFDGQGRKISHARFERVLHNGVLVHEQVRVTGPTRAARFEREGEETTEGPLQLQGDHGPVAFRNIRIRPLDADTAARPLGGRLVAMDTMTRQLPPPSDLSLEQQLDLMQAAGYAGVTWHELGPSDVRPMLDAASARGLRLTALYYPASVTREGVSWDPDLPETMAALSGSDTIIWLHMVSDDVARSSPEADPVVVPALRELAGQAAEHGLRIAIYPHHGDWTERIQDGVRIARAVGHPALGVTFNLCHCLMVGDEADIPDLLAEASPYLFIATVNGADASASGTSWQRLIQPLDQGSFDLRPVLRTLQALRFEGPVAQQGYGLTGEISDNLERSMGAWKRMISEVNHSLETSEP